ncbi:GIY-YIG nuclease family protein [Clostridium botulinum]|uniref:GIY-YIG nuclease family protein n=1 Tax=Clostridium botulinum TaxID=1491 RepID=UPI0019675207|nr:GIY-YIG nuclease family protein [Clostridium botulinum]MBN1074724.1 GIY-YIG nuclease family protein [Clostridium botulinum]
MKIGNLEVYGIIYKIRNKINNKVYIGQTIRKNGLKDRYLGNNYTLPIKWIYIYHLNNKKRNESYNIHLLNSIKKYGFNKFEVVELFDIAFSKEELDIKEKAWISIYKSTDTTHGYNIKIGGYGGKSFEHKFIECFKNNNFIKNNNTNIVYLGYKDCCKKLDLPLSSLRHFIKNNNVKSKYDNFEKIDVKNLKSSRKKLIINMDDEIIYYGFTEASKSIKKGVSTVRSGCMNNRKIKTIYGKKLFITSDYLLERFECY